MKTASEFKAFFGAIPDEKWCVGVYRRDDQCCASGHLGDGPDVDWCQSAENLRGLLKKHFRCGIIGINDCDSDCPIQFRSLKHPKARILAALDEIIAREKGQL